MANGNNTARVSNATNGTFYDESDYARVTSGQDTTEIERSREQTRRLDEEREEREAEEARQEAERKRKTEERTKRKRKAQDWYNSNSALQNPLLTDGDRQNALYIAENTGIPEASTWLNNAINARQSEADEGTARDEADIRPIDVEEEQAIQPINEDYVEGLRDAGYSEEQVQQVINLWNDTGKIDKVTQLVEGFVTPAQEEENKQSAYTEEGDEFDRIRSGLWDRYIKAGGTDDQASADEFNRIATTHTGQRYGLEPLHEKYVNAEKLEEWVGAQEDRYRIAQDNEQKTGNLRAQKYKTEFLPKWEEFSASPRNYLTPSLTNEQSAELMEVYLAAYNDLDLLGDPSDWSQDAEGNLILPDQIQAEAIKRANEAWDTWLAQNAPLITEEADPNDPDNQYGGTHTLDDIVRDQQGNPVLDASGNQMKIYRTVEGGQGYYRPSEGQIQWVDLEKAGQEGPEAAIETEEQKRARYDTKVTEYATAYGLTEDQVAEMVAASENELNPFGKLDLWIQQSGLLPVADRPVVVGEEEVVIGEGEPDDEPDEIVDLDDPSTWELDKDAPSGPDIHEKKVGKKKRTNQPKDDEEVITEDGEPGEYDPNDPYGTVTPKTTITDEEDSDPDADVVDPATAMAQTSAENKGQGWDAIGSEYIKEYKRMGLNDDQIKTVNDYMTENEVGPDDAGLNAYIDGLVVDNAVTIDDATVKTRNGEDIDPTTGLTASEDEMLEEAYAAGGLVNFLSQIDELQDSIDFFFEDPETLFEDILNMEFDSEELNQAIRDGVNVAFEQRDAPFSETISQIDTVMQEMIDSMGYDPGEMRELRRANIDQDVDDAYERMARMGLLAPGATGEYDRAVIEMEKERMRHYRDVDIEINQKALEVEGQNFQLFTDAITKLGDLNLSEYMFTGDITERASQFDRDFELRRTELEVANQQFEAGLISSHELQAAELAFRRQELIQENYKWATDFQNRQVEFQAQLELSREELEQAQNQFTSDLALRDRQFEEAQDQFDEQMEINQRDFDEGVREANRQFEEAKAVSQRDFDQSKSVNQRDFDQSVSEAGRQFEEAQRQFDQGILTEEQLAAAQRLHETAMQTAQTTHDQAMQDAQRVHEQNLNSLNRTNETDLQANQLTFDRENLKAETEMANADIKYKNSTVTADKDMHYAEMVLKREEFHEQKMIYLKENQKYYAEFAQRKEEWDDSFGLDEDKFFETARQFNEQLKERVKEWGDQFGLDQAQQQALIRQIDNQIVNSTRELSLAIGTSWAGITGRTGTGKGTISFDDLGLKIPRAEVLQAAEHDPTVLLDTDEAEAFRGGFLAMMGREATDEELITLLNGNLLEIEEGMPTLEARGMASNIMSQNMERFAKYGAIAEENGLNRDQFQAAVRESDRQWNRLTLNVADEFGLDNNTFRMAIHNRNNMRLRGKEESQIDDWLRLKFGDDFGAFLRAEDAFDQAFGYQQSEIARANNFEDEQWEQAKHQADLHEQKVESTWTGITEGKAQETGQIGIMSEALPQAQRSFVGLFQQIAIDPAMSGAEVAYELKDLPEVMETREMIENAYGKLNDTDWNKLVVDMYESFRGSYSYSDPATVEFEFPEDLGLGRPVWGTKGDRGTVRGAIPWSKKNPGQKFRDKAMRDWNAGLDYTDEQIQLFGFLPGMDIGGFIEASADGNKERAREFLKVSAGPGWATQKAVDAVFDFAFGKDKTQLEELIEDLGKEWSAHKDIMNGMFERYYSGIEDGTLDMRDPATGEKWELPRRSKFVKPRLYRDWFQAAAGEEYAGYPTIEIPGQQRYVGMLAMSQDLMKGMEVDVEVTYIDEFGDQHKKLLTIPPRQEGERVPWEERADYLKRSVEGELTNIVGTVDELGQEEFDARHHAFFGEEAGPGTFVDANGKLVKALYGVSSDAARALASTGVYEWESQGRRWSVSIEELPFLAEREEFKRMQGGWNLKGDVDTTGDGLTFEHVNADWLTELITTNPDIVQSLFALINGGNFSPERQGAAIAAGGDGSGSGAQDFGQMIGQNLPAILSLAPQILPLLGGSDPGMKENIKLLRQSPAGLNIYEFTYKPGLGPVGVYEGVMSTEIPSEAVLKVPGEFDRVFYNKIDVDFKRVG